MPQKIYEREIISDPELLPELEEFIVNLAIENNVPEDKINHLALSFSEAASNGVLHGNKLNKNKKVRIKVIIDEISFLVTIKDEGKGFNIDNVPDPTKAENILKDSGRGIHIMRSFLDKLEFNFTDEGTEVTIGVLL